MQIDNYKRIISLRKRKILLAIAVVFVSGFFAINEGGIIKGKILGLFPWQIAIVISALYILYYLYILYLQPYYFFFNDDNNSIIIRFYSTSLFNPVKQAIEIPKNDFLYYKIHTDFSGLKKSISLFRKTKHGVARYPKISLTYLSGEEIKSLLETLNKYQQL